jgi:hypothetical protein
MSKAKQVYAEAKKASCHPRRNKRPVDAQGVRVKNLPREEDESKAPTFPRPHRDDPKAVDFQRGLDQGTVNK